MITDCKTAYSLFDMTNLQQSSSNTNKNQTFTDKSTQTETSNLDLYKSYFKTNQQPIIISDLNVNLKKARPHIINDAANALIKEFGDFFNTSRLEKFNGTLNEFIYSARRKMVEEISHHDVLYIQTGDKLGFPDIMFLLSGNSFIMDNEDKMLSITLIELKRSMKDELNAIETFKGSLISALYHEFNNPLNSLIPILKMMPKTINDKNEDLKEIALANAYLFQSKIRDYVIRYICQPQLSEMLEMPYIKRRFFTMW